MNLRAEAPVFKPVSLAPAQAISKTRLLKDLKEIERFPLPLVFACPLESDIWTWHVNLIGPEETPYAGGVFHIELKFPQNYPNKNPSAFIYTPLPHPHVHGNRICLDLLSDYDGYFLTASSVAGDDPSRTTPSGWSSAYTAYTILIQLQSFLMELDDVEDNALEGFLSRIPDAILKARQFSCSKCPHRGAKSPWPPLHALVSAESSSSSLAGPDSARSSPSPPPSVAPTDELICFHSKRTHEEDIIGLPIAMPTKQLKDISTPLELLSYTSFKEGVRKSVFGEAFEHFLPLYVDAEHGKRSREVLRRAMTGLAGKKPTAPFDPMSAIDVIPKLMNNLVVSVMDNRTYASVKALVAYCEVHRLLISFVEEYPSLLDHCNEVIANFIRDDKYRYKGVVGSLGELLALLTVSKFTWSDMAEAYLQETFARNVLWTMKRTDRRYGDPNCTDPDVEKGRVKAFWESNVISWRLLAFHVYFLEHIARPAGVPLKQVAANYDARLGQPSEEVKAEFQAAIKEIPQRLEKAWNGNNFAEFFKRISRPVPSAAELDQITKRAVADAHRKGNLYSHFENNRPRGGRGGGSSGGRGGRNGNS